MNDLSQKRLLADQTQDLLDESGLFMMAVRTLREKWRVELMRTRTRAEQDPLVARMQALEAIPELLQTVINDYKHAAHREMRAGPRHG